MDRRQARARLSGKPSDPLHADRSPVAAAARAPRMNAGIAWANEPSGRGWTPILGGSSASPTSARRVRSASSSRSVERRHRGGDVGRGR